MDSSTITASQKDEFIDQYKQQLAVAQTQELLSVIFHSERVDFVIPHVFVSFRKPLFDLDADPQTMTEKCFKKCVSKPGTVLEAGEQKCAAMCMDRFMDSWNLISRAFGTRIQRERHA